MVAIQLVSAGRVGTTGVCVCVCGGGGGTSGVVRGNASQVEISNLKVLPLDLCIYNLIKHKV